jgi:riboflavin kinase/FMN adenylyltransferase
MEVFRALEGLARSSRPVTLALGMFDGVHLGHQAVLARTKEEAALSGSQAGVLTFDPHPQRVIAPPPDPILLTTVPERLGLFAGLGLDLTVVLRFDQTLRQTPPEEWLSLLADAARGGVVSSAYYTFGRDRAGTVETLRAGGARFGFGVTVVPPVHVASTLVSSTLIRRLVRTGTMGDAALFLGRRYLVQGRVVEGERRGRTLGFPTANLEVHPDKVLPAKGIYAGWARREDGLVPAAISVGVRPTFGYGALLVEAHLLDFTDDLYGQEIELVFASRLRDELTFHSVPDLVAQMERDVLQVREVLARAPAMLE